MGTQELAATVFGTGFIEHAPPGCQPMPVSCSLYLIPEMSMLYLMLGPTDQDIPEDPVKEPRKAQEPLLDGLQ